MIIKHVTKRLKDIFLNEGWEQWARIDITQGKVVNTSMKLSKHHEKALIHQTQEACKH